MNILVKTEMETLIVSALTELSVSGITGTGWKFLIDLIVSIFCYSCGTSLRPHFQVFCLLDEDLFTACGCNTSLTCVNK